MTATPPKIRAATVGVEVGPVSQTIDARWLMAYAAGLGEGDRRYYDTLAPAGPLAHPLFPVCYEWPVALQIRAKTIDETLASRSVHSTHHVTIHRAPRAGDRLLTSARVVSVTRRHSGTRVVTRFTTVDDQGEPVTTTDYGSIYRGVDCDGEAGEPPTAAVTGAIGSVRWTERIDLPAWTAHVYTECARIWNPIHTDVAVATRAGLEAIILHGTATLALATSRVVMRDLSGDPGRVREVRARFTGMVRLPSTLIVRGHDGDVDRIPFDAVDPSGATVLSDGTLGVQP